MIDSAASFWHSKRGDRVRILALTILALLAPTLVAQPPAAAPAWPFDEMTLFNGARFQGLILKETPAATDFQVVVRKPGRPTMTLTTSFAAREIAGVKRLSEADRTALQAKLAELDPRGEGERKQMESLDLTDAGWLDRPTGARRYASERFVLVSGASEEVTRRAAVRLEQIYAAFARFFPPRHAPDRPTTVVLAGRAEDYRQLLGRTATQVLNAAIYDPAANRIVCGSDLREFDEQLTASRAKHKLGRAKLDEYEAEVRVLYKGSKPELDRHLVVVHRERDRLREADRQNLVAFDRAARRLFAILYHEAFHSYIATSVYPPATAAEVRAGRGPGELPRWLNEGLAQIFETAVVEAGELRVGHADAERLERVQAMFRAKPPAVGEVLRAGPEQFLAAHSGQKSDASRAYLVSWAVTFHLTFERRNLGTAEFTAYLEAVNTGGDPVAAFEAWVGQDLPAFEAELRDTVLRLTPDGTLAPKRP